MEDLEQLYDIAESGPRKLEQLTEEWLVKLRVILWGPSAMSAAAAKEVIKDITTASPQQTKKRAKRLSSLNEEEAEVIIATVDHSTKSGKLSQKGHVVSPRRSKRSNAELLVIAETINHEKPEPPVADEVDVSMKKLIDEETTSTERKSEASNLMPPPPAPVVPAPVDETYSGRPQRAAKIKSEKNLKEPSAKTKLRRPSNDSVKVKVEHEQRASQMHEIHTSAALEDSSKASLGSSKSNDSVVILPGKTPSTIVISAQSDDEDDSRKTIVADSKENLAEDPSTATEQSETGTRSLRIKIKREKVSVSSQDDKQDVPKDESTFKAPDSVSIPPMTSAKSDITTSEDASVISSSILSSTSTSGTGKKLRKKKEAPRPIKVERFSDLDRKPPLPSPISSRTRHGSTGRRVSQNDNDENPIPLASTAEEARRPGSIYEDAVETPPSRHSKTPVVNETVNLGPVSAPDATMNSGSLPGDATFCTNTAQTTFQVAPGQTTFVVDGNPNSTVTLNKHSAGPALGDATFDIHSSSKNEKDDDAAGQRSFETAKDSSIPHNSSLLTDDESIERVVPPKSKIPSSAKTVPKVAASAKGSYKMPTRTNELFNPLAQSPVKMRVEAFENAAAAASEQPKRHLRNKKENVTPSSATTPIIGKLPAPALGRFLTPTQSSNLTSMGSAVAKKVPTSASKAIPLTKSASATLHRSGSTVSVKTLNRENSADDFRKGLHNLAEERKKQREQKHLLAAQQREAKERERAERMAKVAKEREEKRLQKQLEQEQKRREMEEIQRKLRLQQQEEEAARIKAAKEREMLLQMKQQQQMSSKQRMLPPPPKAASKYTFDMLHEDDSTDDEDKVSYKRPPPPSWSRSHKRGPYVLKQEYTPSCYIDSFFSVQPMTPDLKQIFPNIDARHLKRNSSVIWSTPPRYSELPKY